MVENESGLKYTVSGKEIRVDRPEPITSDIDIIPYKRKMDPHIAIEALVNGDYVLIKDFYSSGLTVLSELKKYLKTNPSAKSEEQLKTKYSNQSFQKQRDIRSEFRTLSHRLLLSISDNKLRVRKAPEIGWLKILYPEINEFLLPFTQVQGLNSSWQWYEKGISIPVLENKIHPFFGTYFPTRFEHLKLFDHWLKQYKGEKKSAIDIGIGCGVLSFQMLQHNFQKIYGTDSNPNAIIGVNEYLKNNKLSSKIDLIHGDLFANKNLETELIVFNPPWLPASHNIEGLDNAIYYDNNLFPRFFADAEKHLKPDGRVVLMFSNLAQITKVSDIHPIEAELQEGGRFQKEIFIQKKVSQASQKTRRNQNWRATEMVELWVLKLLNTN